MLTVRAATEQDLPSILTIQRDAFGEYEGLYKTSAWTAETLEDVKRDAAQKKILVAEWEGILVGSVRFWVVGGVCVIRLLSVSPLYQGRGIAKGLMEAIEQRVTECHKFYVCTMLQTARNVGLFLRLGYRPESVLPNHYNGLDLICLAKYVSAA